MMRGNLLNTGGGVLTTAATIPRCGCRSNCVVPSSHQAARGKAGSAKPKESISEMLEGSETLEFEEDVESSGGGRWGWDEKVTKPDNGHVSAPFSVHSVHQPSRLGPSRGSRS